MLLLCSLVFCCLFSMFWSSSRATDAALPIL
uniref:Uncharacterized protein n=1 Tax=Arundo donax TaxID=35708 RepID=A0A0A9H4G4_ARUDO